MKISQNTVESIQDYILDRYNTDYYKPFSLLLTLKYNSCLIYKLIHNYFYLDNKGYDCIWNASVYCYFEIVKPYMLYSGEFDLVIKDRIYLVNEISEIPYKKSLTYLCKKFKNDTEQITKGFWKPEIYLLLIAGLIQQHLEDEN